MVTSPTTLNNKLVARVFFSRTNLIFLGFHSGRFESFTWHTNPIMVFLVFPKHYEKSGNQIMTHQKWLDKLLENIETDKHAQFWARAYDEGLLRVIIEAVEENKDKKRIIFIREREKTLFSGNMDSRRQY
jgi:hypothetical protein